MRIFCLSDSKVLLYEYIPICEFRAMNKMVPHIKKVINNEC